MVSRDREHPDGTYPEGGLTPMQARRAAAAAAVWALLLTAAAAPAALWVQLRLHSRLPWRPGGLMSSHLRCADAPACPALPCPHPRCRRCCSRTSLSLTPTLTASSGRVTPTLASGALASQSQSQVGEAACWRAQLCLALPAALAVNNLVRWACVLMWPCCALPCPPLLPAPFPQLWQCP
jgi:hypothetical protein